MNGERERSLDGRHGSPPRDLLAGSAVFRLSDQPVLSPESDPMPPGVACCCLSPSPKAAGGVCSSGRSGACGAAQFSCLLWLRRSPW